MKVAAIQMPTVKDKIQNIRTAGTYIEKIKAENPDFVILPEMFCCPYQIYLVKLSACQNIQKILILIVIHHFSKLFLCDCK